MFYRSTLDTLSQASQSFSLISDPCFPSTTVSTFATKVSSKHPVLGIHPSPVPIQLACYPKLSTNLSNCVPPPPVDSTRAEGCALSRSRIASLSFSLGSSSGSRSGPLRVWRQADRLLQSYRYGPMAGRRGYAIPWRAECSFEWIFQGLA